MHHPFLLGGGVEPPTKFSKKKGGGLTGPQLLEGGCWERGGEFFSGVGVQLSHKLKFEIKVFFFVITKNSNWEILPKNFVTFKI